MAVDKLKATTAKVVGIKQTTRALQKGVAKVVYVAEDAEERITLPIMEECKRLHIECIKAETMQALGKACGIHAGASVAAILKD